MNRINRIILSIVLTAFFLNTAISDYAFALAPTSRFDDMAGSVANQDMARIEMTLDYQLKQSLGPDGKTVDIERLIANANQANGSIFKGPIKFARPLHNFVNEVRTLRNGCYRIMCKVKDANNFRNGKENGVRTYYAVFPAHIDDLGLFPIETFTEKEWLKNGGEEFITSSLRQTGNLPRRKSEMPKDAEAKRRYIENNERVIADFIRGRLAAGDFTEIEDRARSLGLDSSFPNRIRPAAYWPGNVLDALRQDSNYFLSIFGLDFDKIFTGKNLVFIKIPAGQDYPVIIEEGQKIKVSSRSSNNAVYFFLKDSEFERISGLARNVQINQSRNTLYYALAGHLMHEAGAICGLSFKIKNGIVTNDLDRAFSEYYDFLQSHNIDRVVIPAGEKDSLVNKFPALRNAKPVDLDILRGVNAAGETYERDYAAGFTNPFYQLSQEEKDYISAIAGNSNERKKKLFAEVRLGMVGVVELTNILRIDFDAAMKLVEQLRAKLGAAPAVSQAAAKTDGINGTNSAGEPKTKLPQLSRRAIGDDPLSQSTANMRPGMAVDPLRSFGMTHAFAPDETRPSDKSAQVKSTAQAAAASTTAGYALAQKISSILDTEMLIPHYEIPEDLSREVVEIRQRIIGLWGDISTELIKQIPLDNSLPVVNKDNVSAGAILVAKDEAGTPFFGICVGAVQGEGEIPVLLISEDGFPYIVDSYVKFLAESTTRVFSAKNTAFLTKFMEEAEKVRMAVESVRIKAEKAGGKDAPDLDKAMQAAADEQSDDAYFDALPKATREMIVSYEHEFLVSPSVVYQALIDVMRSRITSAKLGEILKIDGFLASSIFKNIVPAQAAAESQNPRPDEVGSRDISGLLQLAIEDQAEAVRVLVETHSSTLNEDAAQIREWLKGNPIKLAKFNKCLAEAQAAAVSPFGSDSGWASVENVPSNPPGKNWGKKSAQATAEQEQLRNADGTYGEKAPGSAEGALTVFGLHPEVFFNEAGFTNKDHERYANAIGKISERTRRQDRAELVKSGDIKMIKPGLYKITPAGRAKVTRLVRRHKAELSGENVSGNIFRAYPVLKMADPSLIPMAVMILSSTIAEKIRPEVDLWPDAYGRTINFSFILPENDGWRYTLTLHQRVEGLEQSESFEISLKARYVNYGGLDTSHKETIFGQLRLPATFKRMGRFKKIWERIYHPKIEELLSAEIENINFIDGKKISPLSNEKIVYSADGRFVAVMLKAPYGAERTIRPLIYDLATGKRVPLLRKDGKAIPTRMVDFSTGAVGFNFEFKGAYFQFSDDGGDIKVYSAYTGRYLSGFGYGSDYRLELDKSGRGMWVRPARVVAPAWSVESITSHARIEYLPVLTTPSFKPAPRFEVALKGGGTIRVTAKQPRAPEGGGMEIDQLMKLAKENPTRAAHAITRAGLPRSEEIIDAVRVELGDDEKKLAEFNRAIAPETAAQHPRHLLDQMGFTNESVKLEMPRITAFDRESAQDKSSENAVTPVGVSGMSDEELSAILRQINGDLVRREDVTRQEEFDIASGVLAQNKCTGLLAVLDSMRSLINARERDTIIQAVNEYRSEGKALSSLEKIIIRRAFLTAGEGMGTPSDDTEFDDIARIKDEHVSKTAGQVRAEQIKKLMDLTRQNLNGGAKKIAEALKVMLNRADVTIKASGRELVLTRVVYSAPLARDVTMTLVVQDLTEAEIGSALEEIFNAEAPRGVIIGRDAEDGVVQETEHLENPADMKVEPGPIRKLGHIRTQYIRPAIPMDSEEPMLGFIRELVPSDWLDGWLNAGLFAAAVKESGIGEEVLVDDRSAMIFSEKSVFGEINADGTYEEGIGILLPSMIRSGIKLAVVATTDKQRELIEELNKDKPQDKQIIYRDSIAAARQALPAARYYYYKVASEPDAGLDGVTSITIIVKKIIDAIGKLVQITDSKLIDNMHEAARRFAQAA